ncbi:MAG: ribose-phosphate pyrophosphokinase [Chloroflexi bacterium]|nr:ribose-phosphate pyrophosphokinase [Chloroflexota bacterium]
MRELPLESPSKMTETPIRIPGTKLAKTDVHLAMQGSQNDPRFGAGIRIFSGSSSPNLAKEISEYLNLSLGRYEKYIFSNENLFFKLNESVRGQDVYLIQSCASPIHDHIMEMLLLLDTIKRDFAWRTTIVVPYLTYTRSDKKDQPRVGIAARLLAEMIEVAGADRYMTIDLHAGQIQGFFHIPGDTLTAFHLLCDYVKAQQYPNLVVVATDLGFAKKTRNWAESLNTPMAIVEKRRIDNADQPHALSIIGDVRGKNVLLVDDELVTGGSVASAVHTVREHGARDIYLAFTHPVFAPGSMQRLADLEIKEIITTNTLEVAPERLLPNMTVLSIAPLLGEVIRRSHEGRSVGELFNE